MVLFDGSFYSVSQGFLSGWKVVDKITGAIGIPNNLQKSRIGMVWMQVRRTKKDQSIDSDMSEDVMFSSFAKAVLDPSSEEGDLWVSHSPDELANIFIQSGNQYMQQADDLFPKQ
jgi:hypothetical protein